MDTETTPAEETQTPEVTEAAPTEAPEAAQDAAPETPPANTEEQSGADAEAEGDSEAEEPTASGQSTAEERHKRKGGWQRQVEKARKERDWALEQLAAARAGQPPPAPAAPAQEKTQEEKAAEYLEALVEKRIAAREAQAAHKAQVAEFQRRTQEVRAAHPDFDDVVSALDIPVESPVGQALLTHAKGPAIMYQLASDPAELARISALPPAAALLEIGALAGKSAVAAAPKATPKPLPRKPAAAPAPITPVTARGPTTVKAVKDMSYEEFSVWRDSQSKR